MDTLGATFDAVGVYGPGWRCTRCHKMIVSQRDIHLGIRDVHTRIESHHLTEHPAVDR